MFPEGSETKCRKEIKKQPLTLTIRIATVSIAPEDTQCAIAKRMRLPIPPPIATKRPVLLTQRVLLSSATSALEGLVSLGTASRS